VGGVLVCFGAAMRRSELIALDLDNITITQAGLTILVRRSKTDQEGQGREIGIPRSRKSATCPVAALEAWLALAQSPIDSTCQDDRERSETSASPRSRSWSRRVGRRRKNAPTSWPTIAAPPARAVTAR
jgi:integrase